MFELSMTLVIKSIMGKGSYTGGSTVISTRNNNTRSISSLKNAVNSALILIESAEKTILTNSFTKKKTKFKCSLAINKQSSELKKILPQLLLFKSGITYVESIMGQIMNLTYFDKSYIKNFLIKLHKAKENFDINCQKKTDQFQSSNTMNTKSSLVVKKKVIFNDNKNNKNNTNMDKHIIVREKLIKKILDINLAESEKNHYKKQFKILMDKSCQINSDAHVPINVMTQGEYDKMYQKEMKRLGKVIKKNGRSVKTLSGGLPTLGKKK